MKKRMACVYALLVAVFSAPAAAEKWVSGYTKKDGSYVSGHPKSSPDSYRYNNKGAQSAGGSQRDENSSGLGATNKRNSTYGYRDNDNDGLSNSYDPKPKPKSKRNW